MINEDVLLTATGLRKSFGHVLALSDGNVMLRSGEIMALAAVDAFEVAGKEGILVYGTDFISQAQEAIRAGRLTGSTTFSQYAWTRGALIYTLKLVKGLEIPDRLGIPITLVTRENTDKFDGWR